MENLAPVIGIIFVAITFLLIIGNVIQFLFSIFFSSLNFTREKVWFRTHKNVPDKIREMYEPVLLSRFTYYQKLSDASKQKFLYRIHQFIRSKTFTGRKELEVTGEKKILISAAAIQLTFGLDNFLMDRFSEIYVFPDIFPARMGKNYYRGETNPGAGIIALSWKHFAEGYDIEDDKYNLGLHEMAHALEISGLVDGVDDYFTQNFYKWSSIARSEYENVHNQRASILREYAGTNSHEFFAVCVEHFFEASAEFKERLPEMYHWLSLTLRQDPLLTIESYAESLQQISNQMPYTDVPTPPQFHTNFYLGRLTMQSVVLFLVWTLIILSFFATHSINVFAIPGLVYGGILFMRLSYTYTVFEMYSSYVVLRRPLRFNHRSSVAFDNIIRIEFVENDSFEMIRIFYIDRGNMLSLEKYYSADPSEISELKSRLKEKKVLIKE